MSNLLNPGTLRQPLAALVGGVAVMQVLGRYLVSHTLLRRIGPIVFGTCAMAAILSQLAIIWSSLTPFKIWPRCVERQIAIAVRLSKRMLWPWVIWFCPWISVEVQNRHLMKRVGEDRSRGTMLLLNHTSFFDSPLVCCFFSLRVAAMHRVVAMASVMRMPLLGHIFRAEQHIPVHFASDSKGSFKLKEGTGQETQDAMAEALREKEILIIYPEGQINNYDVRKLCGFRLGGFRLAIQNDVALWGWITVGCQQSWPYGASMGGLPATIIGSTIEIAPDGALAFLKRCGIPTEARENQTDEELLDEQTKALADKVQETMQAELNRLHAERDAKLQAKAKLH